MGERAFEIVLARALAAGEAESKWFERHGSTPITDIPAHWPADRLTPSSPASPSFSPGGWSTFYTSRG